MNLLIKRSFFYTKMGYRFNGILRKRKRSVYRRAIMSEDREKYKIRYKKWKQNYNDLYTDYSYYCNLLQIEIKRCIFNTLTRKGIGNSTLRIYIYSFLYGDDEKTMLINK